MKQLIVTHCAPDLDAIASVWLIRRFLPGFSDADLGFVPAGSVFEGNDPNRIDTVVHVDTGFGLFDHHQSAAFVCATSKVFVYLCDHDHIDSKYIPALERLVSVITAIDHFQEVYAPEPTADLYDLGLHQLIEGLQGVTRGDADKVEKTLPFLDAALTIFRNKLRAEKEITQGMVISTSWGKALVMHTTNEECMKLAQKKGYVLVARKDPEQGRIRIKSLPEKKYDLSDLFERIKAKDKVGGWFLHASKHMLLNGSSKNPTLKPSPITLPELVELIKAV